MRRSAEAAGAILALLLLAPAAARGQGFETAASPPPAEQAPDQGVRPEPSSNLKMRVDVSGGAFVESQIGSAPIENTSITSPNSIYWMDVRGKLDARRISGSRFDVLGDLRIRLNPDPTAPSRGYQGGEEYDLKEAYGTYRGDSVDFGVGRQILREVDAQTIDGLTLVYKMSPSSELGLFGGLYPDPFSRSLEDDYSVITYDQVEDGDDTTPDPFVQTGTELVSPIPIAGGGWWGYRFARLYGAVGLAAILPRNDDPPALAPMAPPISDNRALFTSYGYWRTLRAVDLIHYLVVEGRGGQSPNLVNGQLAVHYRPSAQLLLEAGASRMSSYAVEVYLRDLLERHHMYVGSCPDPVTLCIQNNLDVLRVASNEFRGGFNYAFLESRADVHGQLRYREREGLVLPEGLPVFNADQQYDVSVGARKKRWYGGFDYGAGFIRIQGKRSAANILTLRGSRAIDQRLYIDIDGGYSQYQDMCENSELDIRTCDGTARGFTYRLGALGTWQRDVHWLFIADYHLNVNKAQARRMMFTNADGELVCGGGICNYPYMAAHSFFLRAQYRY